MRRALNCAILLLVFTAAAARGQQADSTYVQDYPERPFWLPVAGGVAGAGVGMVSGGLLGYGYAQCDPEGVADFCGVGEALIGLAIGSTVGSITGAYIGAKIGDGRPSVVRTFVGSVLGVGVGLGAGMLADRFIANDLSGFLAYAVGQGLAAGTAAGLWW